jgi:aryl-alcohol dehydrogenase-like predicted oxidoreductase
VARGILTGKYKVNQKVEPGSRAARNDKRMMEAEWRPESLMIAEKLQQHLAARGISMVHWAVAWVLNNSAVTSAIAGPRTFEQWAGYTGAIDLAWTAEDEALANSLVPPGHSSAHGHSDPEYPVLGRFPRVG